MRLRPWIPGLVVLALLLAACSPFPISLPASEPRDPFTTRIEGADGAVVELNGYARGHQPGGVSTFQLSFRQESDTAWRGRYCVQLLDQQGPVVAVADEQFHLAAGTDWTRSLLVRFPTDLAAGHYGLALVIPDRLAVVTTIEIGGPTDVPAPPWPKPNCP